jgi:hypothetical protein
MSFVTAVAEIGEGDELQVRIGTREWPERVLDATVKWINTEYSAGVLTLTCEITGEAPEWVLEQIRHPTPSEPSPRWWRRKAKA